MEINMVDVLAHHRKEYRIETHLGSIVLRPLTKREGMEIEALIQSMDPGYSDKVSRYDILNTISSYPTGLDQDQKRELLDLSIYISGFMDYFVLRAIKEPKLTTVDDLEALANALTAEEWGSIQMLFPVLTSLGPTAKVDTMVLGLCKEYNIPLASDLTGENMTLLQASVLCKDMADRETVVVNKIKEMTGS